MSFAAGAATFNSCNKAGSIVQFTEHLRKYPNDYNALVWRAKAHLIVGNKQDALCDLQHAKSVSSGVKRDVAEGDFEYFSSNSLERFGIHANRTVSKYKNEWRAWERLGRYQSLNKNDEEATQCWETSLTLAKESREMTDPMICWINYYIGNNRLKKGQIEAAKKYFTDAVESCKTHTVSHIQLCECNLRQGNQLEAKDNFKTALQLNPGLSSPHFGTNSFDEYLMKKSFGRLSTSASGSNGNKQAVGKTGGGLAGSSDGGGDGSDVKKDASAVWKRLRKEAPCIKMYGERKYVQSKCGKFWYSKDTAMHGGAQFKRYEDTRNTLQFKDSLDENLKPLSGKHESRENTYIMKGKMAGVNINN